ncbi:MAG: M3 family metallopeptidase [Bacteroidota bacterium]|nr:M3 family metallopeptidase [Bacteroidota bacterium]
MSRLNLLFLFIIFIALTISSCSPKEDAITTKDQLYVYLDTLEAKYEDACIATGLANWNLYAREGKPNLNAAKKKFATIFFDTLNRKIIEEWRAKSGSLADEMLTRRLELWSRGFIGGNVYADSQISALENNLQELITNFNFRFESNSITLDELANRLKTENNEKQRRKLWLTTSQLSDKAKDDLVKLVKLRNEKAASLGFYNYYSLSLYLQSIREDWLLKNLNELEEKTRNKFKEFIESSKKKLKIKKFHAWDFDAALYRWATISDNNFPKDSIFNILHRFHRNIGFKVDSLPVKEIIKDIPFGGLNIGIQIPGDSRLIINPINGKRFYNIAFHEYGHALQAVHTKVNYPILKGYKWIPGVSSGAYSEGVAEMQTEFVDDYEWLKAFTSASQDEIERYIASRTFSDLYYLRRTLKDFFFEYEMYKNPDRDLAELERETYLKYLLVELDENTPHRFAASIRYTMYPCYYQNYILSHMISAQLFEVLVSKFGPGRISNPDVSRWIISYLYEKGETEEWADRIRNATGKSLETGAYLRKLKTMN